MCLASGTVRGLADGARAEHSDSCVAVNEVYLKCTVYKQVSQFCQLFLCRRQRGVPQVHSVQAGELVLSVLGV